MQPTASPVVRTKRKETSSATCIIQETRRLYDTGGHCRVHHLDHVEQPEKTSSRKVRTMSRTGHARIEMPWYPVVFLISK